MAIFITAYQRRTAVESVSLGTTVIDAGDVVRIKIGRSVSPQEVPKIDLASGIPLNGGSTVTAANPASLKLTGDDLIPSTIQPGIYDIEASVVDLSDGGRIKHIEEGVFVLHPSPGGNVT